MPLPLASAPQTPRALELHRSHGSPTQPAVLQALHPAMMLKTDKYMAVFNKHVSHNPLYEQG